MKQTTLILVLTVSSLCSACSTGPLHIPSSQRGSDEIGSREPSLFGPAFFSHFEKTDPSPRPSPRSEPWQEEDLPVAHHVRLGMTMNEVRGLWGHPDEVGVAGEELRKNQRWSYSDFGDADTQGYIYFENGQVAGWELPPRSDFDH